jgi:hypothetical protein
VGRQEELSLGDDAIELVTGAEPDESRGGGEERTVDLTPAARELRHGRPARTDELAVTGDADWMATQASDRPAPAPETPLETAEPVESQDVQEPPEEAEAPEPAPTPEPAARKPGRKGRRASVPSWDEIMFGGGRSE